MTPAATSAQPGQGHAGSAMVAAAAAQRIASDPAVSAFVSASAGSGKTKLLIDRLLRLMLPGPGSAADPRGRAATSPERILCLTFTKAGAAEMAIRLRRELGRWVIADDATLDRSLRDLDLEPSGPLRDDARALFARVLDIPGGLRIGTIHAFCEQLLRRFPLEAAISPNFRLVEDIDAQAALDRARESMVGLAAAAATVATLAARLDALAHAKLTRALHARSDRLAHAHRLDPEALAAALGRTLELVHADEDAAMQEAVSGPDERAMSGALHTLASRGTDAMAARAGPLREWLGGDPADRRAGWPGWRDLLLTADGKPRSFAASNTKFAREHPGVLAVLRAEADRVIGIDGHLRALQLIEATAALLALSGPSLAAYASEKAALGLLDFDDLIARTRDLLADPGVAWVLFKLDGGIDHLLLDEVQDTSAAQWAIAGSLTEEFFAGASASDTSRTIFAVGDFKQSIYSFQGADPQGFRTWRDRFRARVTNAGQRFVEPSLTVSFRSSPVVLAFVDAVFREERASGGVAEAADTPVPPHESARPGLPGRVELWPLAAAADPADDPSVSPWRAPDRNRGLQSGEQILATALAAHLAGLIGRGDVRPGEVLVLVRRRTHFAGALMRALKSRGVPVAGLDRMVLTAQPAVQDLLALCDALLLPGDDLAVATVLTSPLGGLDDPSLMALAIDREGGLWRTLRSRQAERPDWQRAHDFIARLLARVDFVPPHALLSEALGAGGARARILARLGPEAAEAIDELLASALSHAGVHVPSMQEFVHWVRRSGADVKREPGEAADEVRLMTVHGSKGLEAGLVVLADTTGLPRIDASLLWARHGGETLPIWVPGSDLNCPPVDRLREAELARALEEANRLLYVALTRARQRLIVCGWQGRGELDERCWYAHCLRAFETIHGAEALEFEPPAPGGVWSGRHLVLTHRGDAGAHPAAPDRPVPQAVAPLPAWLGAAPHWRPEPPPPEPAGRRSLVPSRPEGVLFGPVPAAFSPRLRAGRAEARSRGVVIHALLQHLPRLAPPARAEAARRFARRQLDEGADDAVEQALAIIAHPAMANIFGPDGRPEQRLAGLVGDVAVTGIVDRIALGADATDLAEFKSGRTPPATVAGTPVRYLRQMAAYRGVLRSLRPGVPVRCLLVWTEDATVAELPDALLDAHAPR